MKKISLVACFLLGFSIVGCTSPTQPIAAQSLKVGLEQEEKIHNNYRNMSTQFIVDAQVAKAQAAAVKGDVVKAQQVVEETVNNLDVIRYLDVQHERAKALFRIAQGYIWEQQGVLNVMKNEWDAAAKDVAATSQPVK